MASSKTQFNIRLPKAVAARLRSDARRAGRSLEDIATLIFKDFFDGFTISERSRVYEQAERKRTGRPVDASLASLET